MGTFRFLPRAGFASIKMGLVTLLFVVFPVQVGEENSEFGPSIAGLKTQVLNHLSERKILSIHYEVCLS